MTDDPFLAAILANPEDAAPWLIYADWLTERGDPRDEVLRAHSELRQVIAGMMSEDKPPSDLIDRRIVSGHIDFLQGLIAAVELFRGPLKTARWPGIVDSTLDHLERTLALTPGVESAESSLDRTRTFSETTALAAILVQGQPQDVLVTLFERHGQDEQQFDLLACLSQEMIIRGADVSRFPAVWAFRTRVTDRGHPLAVLPLRLMPIESELIDYLRRYNVRGSSCSLPFQLPPEEGTLPLPPPARTGLPTAVRQCDEEFGLRAGAAVRNWQAESNGKIEARAFQAACLIGDGDLSVNLLLSLGLDCLKPMTDDPVRVERIRPTLVMNLLFSAAANGGAYNRGLAGAYGRLAAWESVRALVGASPGVAVEEVAAMSEQCLWLWFNTASGWFYDLGLDLGLVAIRPDRSSLAVLAATDTD